MSHSKDTAGVIAPPPLIFFGLELIGLILSWLIPIPFLPAMVNIWLGALLLVLGGALGAWALLSFYRAHTPVDPYEPSTAIVTSGPYRFTRNPIYVAFIIVYLALVCFFNALLALIFLPIAIFIVDRYVIAREERYLEAKFGAAYTNYKATVRRWL
jgi:protein-S-isoprenylcysteine O-methyltransferase Ste14